MALDLQAQFRHYGRYYQSARKYAQRPEVLVSSSLILSLFTISFFAVVAIRPTAVTISKLWREIQDKKSVQEKLEKKIEDLAKAQAFLTASEEDLALLDLALPDNPEFSRLIRKIEYLAAKHGLLMPTNRFSGIELSNTTEATGPPTSTPGFATHSFSLTLQGTFSQIRSFIEDVERLDRLISIAKLSIRPNKKQEKENIFELTMFVDADAFSFPEGENLD